MKKKIILILFATFLSCKEQPKTVKRSNNSRIYNVYCDSSSVITKEKRSMYNLDFLSIIHQYPLREANIETIKDSIKTICYHNEFAITLLQQQDTVYNFNINIETFTEDFIAFDKNLDRKVLSELKLDSINVRYARTRTLYYDCYLTNYMNNKKYETTIGVDYLKDKGNMHLAHYFTEVTNESN